MSRLQWIALAGLMLMSTTTIAHKQSDSYLTLTAQGQTLHGRWDLALRDLQMVVGLDADGDGLITWGEVRRAQPAIERYAFGRLRLEASNGEGAHFCPLEPGELLIDDHVD